MTGTSGLDSMLNTALEDGVVLSKVGYDQAMESLLHLDFANLDVAAQSTAKWAREVSGIGGIQVDWALDLVGTAQPADGQSAGAVNGGSLVNDLGGMVRKKRKADTADDAAEPKVETVERPAVNMLGGGMVRKKPKAAAL